MRVNVLTCKQLSLLLATLHGSSMCTLILLLTEYYTRMRESCEKQHSKFLGQHGQWIARLQTLKEIEGAINVNLLIALDKRANVIYLTNEVVES